MSELLSKVYCPFCGTYLFRGIQFSGKIEITCHNCNNIINWSFSQVHTVQGANNQQNSPQIHAENSAFEIFKEIKLWRDIAIRKYKKDKSLVVNFKYKYIPEHVANKIRGELFTAKTEGDIQIAFNVFFNPEFKNT